MEALETLIGVILIVFWFVKFVHKHSPGKETGQESGGETAADENTAPETAGGEGAGAPVFAYYYTRAGEKRVDAAKSGRLSGRELTEYEIYCEQQRLDKLWAAELERQEREAEQAREEVYASAEPAETPNMEEIMACARRGGAEHIDAEPVRTTRSSDREAQLAQLDRWLEAGLIDKAEYRKRKREL